MKNIVFLFVCSLIFSGCFEKKHPNNLDGKVLLGGKCSSCHNIDLPPKTSEDEVAPPMMAVAFHIKDFIKADDEATHDIKVINFVKDYVINPSKDKSFCDKSSLKRYGLMPSQKGKVTQDELEAIAKYMIDYFTVKNLTQAQAIESRLRKMEVGKRLALQNNCLSCHKVDKDLIGPSFRFISKKYENIKDIEDSIKNGSKGKYKNFRGVVMPKFGDKLKEEDIKIIANWILTLQ